eukprot:2060054-Rhodomonas_salina.1
MRQRQLAVDQPVLAHGCVRLVRASRLPGGVSGNPAIGLRLQYAISGTDVACGGIRKTRALGTASVLPTHALPCVRY